MNKSLLIKSISNTKFSELSNDKLNEIYHIIKRDDGKKECCPSCLSTRLMAFSSLNYKKCGDCGFEIEWKLKENQKPLVKYQR